MVSELAFVLMLPYENTLSSLLDLKKIRGKHLKTRN